MDLSRSYSCMLVNSDLSPMNSDLSTVNSDLSPVNSDLSPVNSDLLSLSIQEGILFVCAFCLSVYQSVSV